MLYIGADHAGYEMKEKIKRYFEKENIKYSDMGTDCAKSCNYPEIAKTLCNEIKQGDKGILICGTGLGMSMVANRFNYIRAALCTKKKQAIFAKEHNNANVLVLQGRDICFSKNKRIIKAFLTTNFSGSERHVQRINQFSEQEPEKLIEEPISNDEYVKLEKEK